MTKWKKKKKEKKIICPRRCVAYASQGTPPSSPAAAASVFSRVIGAAQAQKQPPGSPLGIAAVLLQGAQGTLLSPTAAFRASNPAPSCLDETLSVSEHKKASADSSYF